MRMESFKNTLGVGAEKIAEEIQVSNQKAKLSVCVEASITFDQVEDLRIELEKLSI